MAVVSGVWGIAQVYAESELAAQQVQAVDMLERVVREGDRWQQAEAARKLVKLAGQGVAGAQEAIERIKDIVSFM